MNSFKAVHIYTVFDNFVFVVRNVRPYGKMVYFTYLWLILNIEIILESLLHLKITHQKILGYRLYFSNFTCFSALFQEIFFSRVYNFETDNPQPVILDCGANIGLASLYFKLKYPQSQIICFEPAQTTFGFLKKNLSNFSNMKLVRAGLSNRNNRGSLYHFHGLEDVSFSTNNSLFPKLGHTAEAIRLVKLSEYTKKLKTIDFLKLDIEGDEEKVLRELEAARQLDKVRQLFIEFHNYSGISLAKILSILEKNRFQFVVSNPIRPPFNVRADEFYYLFVFAYR